MTAKKFANKWAIKNGYDDFEQFVYEIEDYQEATKKILTLLEEYSIEIEKQILDNQQNRH